MLEEFYAVTTSPTSTSVYHVRRGIGDEGYAVAEKIALRGESPAPVGQKLGSVLIAICKCLVPFIPEGGGITSYNREIESVNTAYWGPSSSLIVALFVDRVSAMRCFESSNLVAHDRRWIKDTKAVIAAVGDDHPRFTVCRRPNLMLVLDEPE